jgi:hypothetical protein
MFILKRKKKKEKDELRSSNMKSSYNNQTRGIPTDTTTAPCILSSHGCLQIVLLVWGSGWILLSKIFALKAVANQTFIPKLTF